MTAPRSKLACCAAFTLVALLMGGGEAVASSYYSVKDLGPGWDLQSMMDGKAHSEVRNEATGISIPFSVSSDSHPLAQDKLPTSQYQKYYREIPYGTFVDQGIGVDVLYPLVSNAEGDVIGTLPYRSNGKAENGESIYLYAKRMSDGSYGPMTFFNYFYAYPWGAPHFHINAIGQFLNDEYVVDIDKGIWTTVDQLVAPEILAQYGGRISSLLLADDGSILARASQKDGPSVMLLLTPPTPTPEPTTFALLAVAGAGVAYRRFRRV